MSDPTSSPVLYEPFGDIAPPPRRTIRLRVGPLSVWIRRQPFEWVVVWETGSDPQEGGFGRELREEPVPDLPDARRFAVADEHPSLGFTPQLADRPVVVRPEKPFTLLAGQTCVLYVGTPMWVRLQTGTPPLRLFELPCVRLSDTWFGTPFEGQLGYASKTSARLQIEDMPRRPWRILTPVILRNRGKDGMSLERISLPAPHLTLYQAEDGTFWTQPLEIERGADGVLAQVRMEASPPSQAQGARVVAEPRVPAPKHSIFSALSALLS